MKFFNKLFSSSTIQNNIDCDYIVFDLETSGLDIITCEIIEVGAIKVFDDEVVDSFSSLICPKGEIDKAAIEVNSISLIDLYNAPTEEYVIPDFFNFISGYDLCGYNIKTFDIPILRRYARKYNFNLSNNVNDVLPLARQKLGFLKNKTLSSVAAYFKIDTSFAHRAVSDCKITLDAFKKLVELPDYEAPLQSRKYSTHYSKETYQLNELYALIRGVMSDGELENYEIAFLSKWLKTHEELKGNYPFDRVYAVLTSVLEDGIIEDAEGKELITLFNNFIDGKITAPIEDKIDINGKFFVVTGEFELGDRDFVVSKLESLGGINRKSVSGKTDYLIVGDLGSSDWTSTHYGTKIKKAKELQLQGKNITIISESDFFANS